MPPPSMSHQESVTVQMVAHACVFISAGAIGLLTDPWLEGEIFNHAWAPLFPTELSPALLQQLTHVWISHEHPDHLHFPSLRRISPDVRSRVTLLYQRHPQRAVVNALKQLGFKRVIELPGSEWHDLDEEVSIACFPAKRIDSALALRRRGITILNVNDCKLTETELQYIASRLDGGVDLLLGQYSIAGWVGNKEDVPSDRRYKVIKRTAHFFEAFKARSLLLFASHAWFCHEENQHMNNWSLSPRDALAYMKAHGVDVASCIAALPGDRWNSEMGFSVASGFEIYDEAIRIRRLEAVLRDVAVSLAEIVSQSRAYLDDLHRSDYYCRVSAPSKTLTIFLDDLGLAVEFNLTDQEVRQGSQSRDRCDIALSSQTLQFSFQHRWGFDTLDTSGRFEVVRGSKDHVVLQYCWSYGAAFVPLELAG